MPGLPTAIVGGFSTKTIAYGDTRIACHFQLGYATTRD
jgi:hypothetical protein